MRLKFKMCSPVSLTQLVGHCIIYTGGRGSNIGHPTYPPYGWNSQAMTKKKKIQTV
jgi:hypothetical protein